MLPFIFEWHWDLGHFVFMGLFYAALGVIGVGLAYVVLMTAVDAISGKVHHHEHEEEEGGPPFGNQVGGYYRSGRGFLAS